MAWGRRRTRSAYALDSRGRKRRRKTSKRKDSKRKLEVHVKVKHHY